MSQDNQKFDQAIIDKAMRDEAFRQRLLRDPRGALQDAFGAFIPASVTIHVHEETASDVHIVIPGAKGAYGASQGNVQELSDADLEVAVGGMMASGGKTGCCTCGRSTAQSFSSVQKGCGC
ncbi:MAG TPA: NHLP leader peptide family RiPP precursor [Ktedonobacteraceae bacterium]|nr:NHLP leader peptide family RiPP precursor [Ktedonobacteraceae bacterium]